MMDGDVPPITKDEFIDAYIRDSGIGADVRRTPWGLYWNECPDIALKAVRCRCGDEMCRGWVMSGVDDIAWRKANGIQPPVGQEE